MIVTFTLKILGIKQETADTITLCLKQPGLKKIKYLPGQYLTLVFRINGRKYSRPYSFSSAPVADEHLEITVKRVPGGKVSNHIHDFLKVGDTVQAIQPMGGFIFNTENFDMHQHIVLWGVGSGITPLISIIKYILHNKTGNRITLIYGNRNVESVIFSDKIKELADKFHPEFKVWQFHSLSKTPCENADIIEGRINPERVLSSIEAEMDLCNTRHFICGPKGLKDSIKESLQNLAIKDEHIFLEDFEVQKNPEDFKDIYTQYVNIWKENQANKIEVVKGKSILDAGLDAWLDLDYSCQTGSCLLCKAKVLAGEIKMTGLNKRPDNLLADECLLCCSYPLTDGVEVKV